MTLLSPVISYMDSGGSLDRAVTSEDAAALELSSSVPKSCILDVARPPHDKTRTASIAIDLPLCLY